MSSPVTRAEFEALAKRIADLEKPPCLSCKGLGGFELGPDVQGVRECSACDGSGKASVWPPADHAPEQPAPAVMPKCPACGLEMVPSAGTDRTNRWECTQPCTCMNPAVVECGCGEAYCAAHLPKPKAAQPPADEPRYPCAACGKLRTKAEGGECLTTCEGLGYNCDGTPEAA